MSRKTRLELNWIGKDQRPKLEPRILKEDGELSYHASARHIEADIFDNALIQGDNLLALKALESEYVGRVRCIYIDPPYNTGSAFEHYNDGVEHSLWLSLMRDRIELLRSLLHDTGTLWISIDDRECHYLKVLCDEIFGRENFLTSICWEKIYTLKNTAKHFSEMHDYILVYAKDKDQTQLNLIPRSEKNNSGFRNLDDDPNGVWMDSAVHARNYYSKGSYVVRSPSGKEFSPPPGRYWTVSQERFNEMDRDGRIWWGKSGSNAPRKKTYIHEVKQGIIPGTIWDYESVGQNAEAKEEIKKLFAEEASIFITPKPERLLKRILEISTNTGDLVLDSFAGTGTTGAVAHKMGRRWIMVELGDQAVTHIVPRLKKVIDGADAGGVTEVSGWVGGGGFRFYHLAPSLLQKDRFGNWIISSEYNAAMLAEAVCKHLGFTYSPGTDSANYWKHGHSTESDFIFVTTQALTYDALKKLSEEVGPKRSLLVCCKAFNAKENSFHNLTIKKIPHSILSKCEWGRDDYSLRIASLPEADSVQSFDTEVLARSASRRGKAKASSMPLFDAEENEQ